MSARKFITNSGPQHQNCVNDGSPNLVYRIILAGPQGHGKSKTGNVLFRNDTIFGTSTTRRSNYHWDVVQNYPIMVCDTPGLMVPEGYHDNAPNGEYAPTNQKTSRDDEITKSLRYTHPGPHVVLYILNVMSGAAWEQQHQVYFNEYKRLFGKEVLKHTIVACTGLDDLTRNDKTLDDFMDGAPEELKAILDIKELSNRYIGIDNTAIGMLRHSQVSRFLQRINALVTANEGGYLRAKHSCITRPQSTADHQPVFTFRVLLVGPPGEGKSAMGNLLFDCRPFHSTRNANILSTNSYHWDIVQNHPLLVYDSMGFSVDDNQNPEGETNSYYSDASVSSVSGSDDSDSSDSNDDESDENSEEVKRAMNVTSPGPHVFLYVIRIPRSTDEHQISFASYKRMFGKKVLKNTMIVFTHLDELKDVNKTVDGYIKSSPVLQDMLAEVNGRFVAVSNNAMGLSRYAHIQGILQGVTDLVAINDGQFYRFPRRTRRSKYGSYDISPVLNETAIEDSTTSDASDETADDKASEEHDESEEEATDTSRSKRLLPEEPPLQSDNDRQDENEVDINSSKIEQLKVFYQSCLEKYKEREEAAQKQLQENTINMERLSAEYRANLVRLQEQEVRAHQREILYDKLIEELQEGRDGKTIEHAKTPPGPQCVELGISRTMTFTGNPSINMERFLQTDFKDFGMDDTAKLVLQDIGKDLGDNETITRISYMKLEDSHIYVSEYRDTSFDDGLFTQTSC